LHKWSGEDTIPDILFITRIIIDNSHR
jgi:hypothetical protein